MKPTQKKSTKADALARQKKGAASSAKKQTGIVGVIKSIDPVMIAAAGLVMVLLLGAIFYFVFAGQPAETVQVQQPVETVEDEFGEPDPVEPVYPPDYYMSSATPIQTLATQSVDQAFVDHPNYTPGVGFTLPDGTVYADNSLEMSALERDVSDRVLMDLNTKSQVQTDSETGATRVLARNDRTGGMEPLDSEVAASTFQNQAYRTASTAIDNIVAQQAAAQAAAQQQAAAEPEPEPQPAITDEEKRKYVSLIETQERENKKLRDEMAAVQKEMLEQREQVIDVIQRIENSPVASQRLRASMLPEMSGLKQHTIVGDRVWFTDNEGNMTTHSIGDVIDGTKLMISGTDEASGVVLVTPR